MIPWPRTTTARAPQSFLVVSTPPLRTIAWRRPSTTAPANMPAASTRPLSISTRRPRRTRRARTRCPAAWTRGLTATTQARMCTWLASARTWAAPTVWRSTSIRGPPPMMARAWRPLWAARTRAHPITRPGTTSIAAAAACRAAPTQRRPTTMQTLPFTSPACAHAGSCSHQVALAAWTRERSTTTAPARSMPLRSARFASMVAPSRPTCTTLRAPTRTTNPCVRRRQSTAASRRRPSTTRRTRPSNATATACMPSPAVWTRQRTTTTARPTCPTGCVTILCSGARSRVRLITWHRPPRAMARALSTWSAAPPLRRGTTRRTQRFQVSRQSRSL